MLLNALGLLAVSATLLFAFADQLIYRDLPCPLCILQRAGMVAAGFGLALNLRFGVRPSHYGVMILGALVGGAVSVRQILLHIVPGSGAYGNPFLGLHFYTWAFIVSTLIVIGGAVMLLFDRQFRDGDRQESLAGLASPRSRSSRFSRSATASRRCSNAAAGSARTTRRAICCFSDAFARCSRHRSSAWRRSVRPPPLVELSPTSSRTRLTWSMNRPPPVPASMVTVMRS